MFRGGRSDKVIVPEICSRHEAPLNGAGTGLLLSRRMYEPRQNNYFRMLARTFVRMLCRGSNIQRECYERYPPLIIRVIKGRDMRNLLEYATWQPSSVAIMLRGR